MIRTLTETVKNAIGTIEKVTAIQVGQKHTRAFDSLATLHTRTDMPRTDRKKGKSYCS